MSDDDLKTVGEYVVLLERNGNNFQQTFAYNLIQSALEWKDGCEDDLEKQSV